MTCFTSRCFHLKFCLFRNKWGFYNRVTARSLKKQIIFENSNYNKVIVHFRLFFLLCGGDKCDDGSFSVLLFSF